MFQSFDDLGGPAHGQARAGALRAALKATSLDGFIIPSTDEYQNEMPPPSSQRLLWLTGFTGSWGLAIVLAEKASLFVDGRYVLQAGAQVDGAVFTILKIPDAKPLDWLRDNLPQGARIGYDPHLHTINEVKTYLKAVEKAGGVFVSVDSNPIDAIWTDRPAPPMHPARTHDLRYAGVAAAEKLADIQLALKKEKQDAVVLTAPESIAWAFNIRGGDVQHTPLALGHAIIPAYGAAQIFMAPEKIDDVLRAVLAPIAQVLSPEALEVQLALLSSQTVRLDVDRASAWFAERLEQAGAIISEGQDPCVLPRACKNQTEIDGSKAAHLRDGLAAARFLAWLDANAPGGTIDEIGAAQKLEEFRRATCALADISFDTIAGAGSNGAIVHYRPSYSTNRKLELGSLFLIDSGGQYQDGTTDITRTVAIGAPTDDMRRHFTVVLKAHIALA
ncbi:MAG: aminopeptidase P family N-terminal domain-containing protein, partial [Chitinophagales bacterium]|nr:aminopeptidase P family N-terminal domain-containing protein [Hyphomicrobiales bacterium]